MRQKGQKKIKTPSTVTAQTSSSNILELTNAINVTKEVSTDKSSTSNPLINDTTDTEEVSSNASGIQIVKKVADHRVQHLKICVTKPKIYSRH
jgi:hypothetical protein